jgi:hypothetical protein
LHLSIFDQPDKITFSVLHQKKPVFRVRESNLTPETHEIATLARRSAPARRHVVPRNAGLLAMTTLLIPQRQIFLDN